MNFFPPYPQVLAEKIDNLFFSFLSLPTPSSPPFLCLVVLDNALVMNCYGNIPGLLLVVVLFTVIVFICRGRLRVPSLKTFTIMPTSMLNGILFVVQ